MQQLIISGFFSSITLFMESSYFSQDPPKDYHDDNNW